MAMGQLRLPQRYRGLTHRFRNAEKQHSYPASLRHRSGKTADPVLLSHDMTMVVILSNLSMHCGISPMQQ